MMLSVISPQILFSMRPVIYQLFVRHFSNSCTTGVEGGDREKNGCGTFDGVSDAALAALSDSGVTHLWLTGVLRHATCSCYGGQESSSQALVKGKAGSPYAVSDYFDVDADLAVQPENRMQEFEELLARVRRWGMIPMIDFIPNHVSRDYRSHLFPELDFAQAGEPHGFFQRDQAFYYLEASSDGPPLTLPQGVYAPEIIHGRVTGNNAATWQPSVYDWYETVKLNYGVDYRLGAHACDELPPALTGSSDVPRTWRIMDAVLSYWQEKGVGGFRCDMAHMIPIAFWAWCTARCRQRDATTLLIAEAYNDHMKMVEGDVQTALLDAGFDAVYDAPSYEGLRSLYEHGTWANDLDKYHHAQSPLYRGGVRYLENHDEPRLCSPLHWGALGEVVREGLMLAQYASSQGPILFYNGQEFGERAEGAGGFGGDGGRTSIFDYTTLPRLQRWAHEGRFNTDLLTEEEQRLQAWIASLLREMQEPAFGAGDFYGLNWANQQTLLYGRAEGDTQSGHWFYSFLRYHKKSNSCYLALCHLGAESQHEYVQVHIPQHAQQWCRRDSGMQRFISVLDDGSAREEMIVSPEILGSEGLRCRIAAGKALLLRWELA